MNPKHVNSPTDQHLVDKVLAGDSSAFEVIIKKTERLVAQIVFKMISRTEDRKDIAQDIYLKAFKNLPTFKFQSKLSTWIATIAYNTCVNHLEKRKMDVLPSMFGKNEDDQLLARITNQVVNPSVNEVERSIFQKELSHILQTEIEMLPPLYKTLITLYHNEELSYSEIAQITQLPEGTLKNYLFRARKALKESLVQKYNREAL